MAQANRTLIRHWAEEEGPHYIAEGDRYDTMLAEFGEALFAAAALQPGEHVLDVGCGTGTTTMEAARRVQPGGRAVGIDVSPPMLALARQRAEAAGMELVEFIEGDAQVHPFEEGAFDVVISRNGVMFFEDPAAAFANLARALRPGGRAAFVAPQGPVRAEWIMAAATAAAPHVGVPQGIGPNEPGPSGFADSNRVRSILEGAGFTDVTIEEVVRSMRIGHDVDDALNFIRSMPRVRDLFARAPADQRMAASDAVRNALVPYAGPSGVVMSNNGEWLVTAWTVKSGAGI